MGLIHPTLKDVEVVLAVGAVEGALWAFSQPALNAFLMDAVPERRAEAQGVVVTMTSASMAVGSLLAGSLFAAGVAIPFLAATAAGGVFAVAAIPDLRAAGSHRCLFLLRRGAPERRQTCGRRARLDRDRIS
jgi:MFS family permease